MRLRPLRLRPGDDVRRALEAVSTGPEADCAFVVSGLGSLTAARLRYAGDATETALPGPLEILGVSGTLTPDGAHLHMAVSDAKGGVFGGHVGPGCVVRTTAEILLALLPPGALGREFDAVTGFAELVVRRPPTATELRLPE